MAKKIYDCSGVIPACLLPLHDDLSIDQQSYRKHLRDLAAVRGLAAVTVNGSPVNLSLPAWASYQFGESAGAE